MQNVAGLQKQLATKEEEMKVVRAQLNEASRSLSTRMEAVNSQRKASNDLRKQMTSFSERQQVRAASTL